MKNAIEFPSFSINQSWPKTRLVIDGKAIYEAGSNKDIIFFLDPGNHSVEIENKNNWHTTEFSLAFFDNKKTFSSDDIKSRLNTNMPAENDIYFPDFIKVPVRTVQ